MSVVFYLPSYFSKINILLVFLVFFLEVDSSMKTIWWFLVVGFIFDLYNSPIFGFWLLFWPLIFLFCRFFYVNILTDKSLYSFLGLSSLTSIFYSLLFAIMSYMASVFGGEEAKLIFASLSFWRDLLLGVVLNSLAVFFLFHLTNQATNRLRPVFIFRKR